MNTVSIRVQKRDGSLVDYDGAEVAASIADAARGLDDELPRAVQLRSEVEITHFDRISTDQLDDAVIHVALANVKDDPAYDTIAARLLTKKLYKQVFDDTHDLFGDGAPETIRQLQAADFSLVERFGNLWCYTLNFRKVERQLESTEQGRTPVRKRQNGAYDEYSTRFEASTSA